ncbi:MAG: hypothetical protein ANABAC_1433 [Anaerolineae bacterium]|nr:MAG: hypothetical protein ANABAC_1433 [Anaerolineae bacterium]
MSKRILWINPIGFEGFNKDIYRILEGARAIDTEVEVVSLPADRPHHLQYHAYEGLEPVMNIAP